MALVDLSRRHRASLSYMQLTGVALGASLPPVQKLVLIHYATGGSTNFERVAEFTGISVEDAEAITRTLVCEGVLAL